jgi:hypothetical protein
MINVVGVYEDPAAARDATERLRAVGIPEERRLVLIPGKAETDTKLARVPVSETEQPGMGKTIGGLVGTAVGASAGAGAAAALIPGVGPVTAIGLLGMSLFGAGGWLAGAKLGQSIEEFLDQGLPVDELYVYEDALRKGRSVVIAFASDAEQAEQARATLRESGAESVDAARAQWWVGLQSAEEEEYTRTGGDWARDEATFRAGFEAALLPAARGRSYKEALELLRRRYPELHAKEAFKRGFERGQTYLFTFERNTP